MTKRRIEVVGAEKVAARIRRWEKTVLDQIVRETNATADDVVAAAQEVVPVRRGWLKASIRKRKLRGFREVKGSALEVVAGDARATYAIYVHEGTHRTQANPFLRRAFEQVIATLRARTAGAVRRGLADG